MIEIVFKMVVSEVFRKGFKKREACAIRGEGIKMNNKTRKKKNTFLS